MSKQPTKPPTKQPSKQPRRTMIVVICAVVVVVIAGVIAAVTLGDSSSSDAPTVPTGVDAAPIVARVTSVPAGVLDQVGAGTVHSLPAAITGEPLTSNGKPELLYIGAEFCPFCAGEEHDTPG